MYFIFIVFMEFIFIQNSVANDELDSLIEGVLNEPIVVTRKDECIDKKPIKKYPPKYPISALAHGVEGGVILEIAVEKGRVTEAKIISSKPKGVFDDSAISAIKKWRFSPNCEYAKSIEQSIRYVIQGKNH